MKGGSVGKTLLFRLTQGRPAALSSFAQQCTMLDSGAQTGWLQTPLNKNEHDTNIKTHIPGNTTPASEHDATNS